jgi:hypothetical protein
MNNLAWLLVMSILSSMLAGCGKSETPPVKTGNTGKLCDAIKGSPLVMKCSVSNRDSAVAITIDTQDDEAARRICLDLAGRMRPLAAGLSGQWNVQIFSPYRDDRPLNYCALY